MPTSVVCRSQGVDAVGVTELIIQRVTRPDMAQCFKTERF